MKLTRSAIAIIVLAFTSIILTTGSPFQITNDLDKNNGNLSIKNIGQVYGEDDDDEHYSSDESSNSNDDESEDLPEHYTETSQGVDEDIADIEDDLADADTDEEKERIGDILDEAKKEQSDK